MSNVVATVATNKSNSYFNAACSVHSALRREHLPLPSVILYTFSKPFFFRSSSVFYCSRKLIVAARHLLVRSWSFYSVVSFLQQKLEREIPSICLCVIHFSSAKLYLCRRVCVCVNVRLSRKICRWKTKYRDLSRGLRRRWRRRTDRKSLTSYTLSYVLNNNEKYW